MAKSLLFPEARDILNCALREQGLRTGAFAKQLGLSRTAINGYRAGQDRPSEENINKIIKKLRLPEEQAVKLWRAWGYGEVNRLKGYGSDDNWSPPRLEVQQKRPGQHYQQRVETENTILETLNEMQVETSLLIYGLAGVGKTTLISQVGNDSEIYRSFPGGILFAEVGPGVSPPQHYLKRWLSEMAQTPAADWVNEYLKTQIRKVLDDRRTLVWLDGVTHARDLAPFEIMGGQVCYLVTSRYSSLADKVGADQCPMIEIQPLNEQQSLALLKNLLSKKLCSSDKLAHYLKTVVELCQGIPLALELAAKAINCMEWDTFLTEIKQPKTRLLTLALPFPEKPAHSLLLILLQNYQLLSSNSRHNLHKLRAIIAPDGYDVQHIPSISIALIWDIPVDEVGLFMRELIDAGFVRQVEAKIYTLQPFISEFLTILDSPDIQQEILATQHAFLTKMLPQRGRVWSISSLESMDNNPDVYWCSPYRMENAKEGGFRNKIKVTEKRVETWLNQFALLRISDHLANYQQASIEIRNQLPQKIEKMLQISKVDRDSFRRPTQFLQVHLLTAEYLAIFYPHRGLTWARQAYELSLAASWLEQAVMGQVYSWFLKNSGKLAECRSILTLAANHYKEIGDLYGQLACSVARQEPLSLQDSALLECFLNQKPDHLNRDDANLLLYIAGELCQQSDYQAERCYTLAQQIYQHAPKIENTNYLRNIVGEGVELFGTKRDEEKWPDITQAPFYHRKAWQQLDWFYRPVEIEETSKIIPLPLTPASSYLNLFEAIAIYGHYLSSRFEAQSSDAYQVWDYQPHQDYLLPQYLTLYLYRRALSSLAALRHSLHHRQASLRSMQQYNISATESLISGWAAQTLVLDERDVFSSVEENMEYQLENICFEKNTDLYQLDKLLSFLPPDQPEQDVKLSELLRRVSSGNRKVILFTHYKDTLIYLEHHLKNFSGYKTKPVIVSIDGSLSETNQQKQVNKFDQAQTSILLATDTVSYRLRWKTTNYDLFNYDLPWSAVRLEQRLKRFEGAGMEASFIMPFLLNTWEFFLVKNLCEISTLPQEEFDTALSAFNTPNAAEILGWMGTRKSKLADDTKLKSQLPSLW